METAMTKVRNTAGKFAAKSDVPRKVRSVNLTDNAWQWLAQTAEQAGISRNDYLEALADGSPIMETAQAETKNIDKHRNSKALPIMETVQAESELHKQAEIAELRRQLENADRLLVRKNQEIFELESNLKKANEKILDLEDDNSEQFKEIQAQDVKIQNLESELASEKNKSSATTGKDLSEIEAADILNTLKSQRKKSKADLADIEAVLEILDK